MGEKKGFERVGAKVVVVPEFSCLSRDKNIRTYRVENAYDKIDDFFFCFSFFFFRENKINRWIDRYDIARGAMILGATSISLLMQSVNWRQCRGRLLSHKVSSGRSAQLRVRAIIGEFIVGSVSALAARL